MSRDTHRPFAIVTAAVGVVTLAAALAIGAGAAAAGTAAGDEFVRVADTTVSGAPGAPGAPDDTTAPSDTAPSNSGPSETAPTDTTPGATVDTAPVDTLVGAGTPDDDIDPVTATIAVVGFVALVGLAGWWMVRRDDPDAGPMPPSRPPNDGMI